MDFNFKIISHIIAVIGSAFLMFNLKMQFADDMWNYFFSIQIFMFNFSLSISSLKEIFKNKKIEN